MNFILISEASELTGLSRQTIRNWIDGGVIPAQKVNGTFYVDKDTFLSLAEKMQDVDSAKKNLDALKEEYFREKEMFRDMYREVRDEHNAIRFLSVCVNSGFRTRFFENMVHLMHEGNILSEKEANVLTEALNGTDLDDIAKKYNSSRERIRKIVEKAIRKSRELSIDHKQDIEEKDKEIKALKEEVAVLKRMVYKDAIHFTEEDLNDNERVLLRIGRHETMTILSKQLDEEPFTIRTLNALKYCSIDGKKGIKTVGELCRIKKTDFFQLRNVGKKTLDELTEYLNKNGLTWGMNIDRVLELL